MYIGIVGSTQYPHLDDVRNLVRIIAQDSTFFERGDIIVSGGADGVDKAAENESLACGMGILSYRVVPTPGWEGFDPSYSIQELHLGGAGGGGMRVMTEEPTWATYVDALFYRNILIARRSDRLVGFKAGDTRGTTFTMDIFKATGRPIREYGLGENRLVVS